MGGAAPRSGAGLDPTPHSLLKHEKGTLIWREVGTGGEATVVKLYRRRGWLTVLRERLTGFRAQREYLRLRHLTLWAVPCTEPLGWFHGRSPEHGRYEALVMREVPGAVPLSEWAKETGGPLDLDPLLRIVRRMHDSGLVSQTLYPTNVLVRPATPAGERFVIADLPRSWVFPVTVTGSRLAYYDLLDLAGALEESGVEFPEAALDAYGLDERGHRWWARHRGARSRSKLRRFLRDCEARLRWTCAWAARVRLPFPGGASPGRP